MTCKDCIFNEICERREDLVQLDDFTWDEYGESNEVEKYCSIFRNEADFVEVVRCKDCEHWHYTGKGLLDERVGACSNDDFPFHCEQRPITRETDFCSYGERRKDAD